MFEETVNMIFGKYCDNIPQKMNIPISGNLEIFSKYVRQFHFFIVAVFVTNSL